MAITTWHGAIFYELKLTSLYAFLMILIVSILAYIDAITQLSFLPNLTILIFVALGLASLVKDILILYGPGIHAGFDGIGVVRITTNILMMYTSSYLFEYLCQAADKDSGLLNLFNSKKKEGSMTANEILNQCAGYWGTFVGVIVAALFIISCIRTIVTVIEFVPSLIRWFLQWIP